MLLSRSQSLRKLSIIELTLFGCVLCMAGCVTGRPSAEVGFYSVGLPIATVSEGVASSEGQDNQSFHEYLTNRGTRVVVIPNGANCNIHYFVNDSAIVSGFMLLGSKCTTFLDGDSDFFYEEKIIEPAGQ